MAIIVNDDGTMRVGSKTYSNKTKTKTKTQPKVSKTNNEDEKKWYEEYINIDRIKEIDSFKDYYDFQLNTSSDLLGNAIQGVVQGAEGLSDFARNRYADVADKHAKTTQFLGMDGISSKLTESANKARENALVNDTQDMIDSWEHIISGDLAGKKKTEDLTAYEDIHKNSALGDSGREMTQSIALNLTNAGLNAMSGGTLGIPLIAVSSAGNAEQEALQNGATIDEARTYGILMGGIEAGTEMLAGGMGKISEGLGFGKGAVDDQIIKRLNKKLKDTILDKTLIKNLSSFAIKSVGEGLEEVLAGLCGAIAQKLTYMSEEELSELIKNQDLRKAFISGALSSVIMQAPSTITSTAQGRDVNTGLTQVQQKYVNEIAEQRLVEAQKRNEKLNGYQQMKIEDRALEDFQKGRLFDSSKLPLSEDLRTMDLQQSAYKYGINPNSEAVVNIKTMLENRGVKSRFDAKLFEEIDGNALWTKNNGVREVVLNPNASADVILEELAIHELTHDLMSSSNSKSTIESQKIIDYVSTLKGYEEARQRVEEKYKKQTQGMSKADAKAYIDEEIVADTLGKNIGSQEYVRKLVDSEPKLSKVIYNWVVDTVNNLANKNGVKNEKLYWENIKNSFESAYNMEYVGKGSKKNTKFKKRYPNIDNIQTIDYNNLNQEIVPYIATDERKAKFIQYGQNESFYELDYETMEKAVAIGSKAALEAQQKGLDSYSFNDDKYVYDFEIIDKSRNTFGITNVEKLKTISEEVYDERETRRNSRLSNGKHKLQEERNNYDNQSVGNTRTSEHLARMDEEARKNRLVYNEKESDRNQKQELDNDTDIRYSLIGEKGANKASKANSDNKFLVDSLEKAKQLRKQRFTNEEIRQKTMWFQDPNGKWLFEISDKDAKLAPLEKNKTYKLSDILKHEDLFEVYPELNNIKVKTKSVKNGDKGESFSGYYNVLTKTIVLNNEFITPKYAEYMRGTLLHEIQHRIQVIEGLEKGNTGKNYIQYFSSLGEIESTDVEGRQNMSYEDILKNAPEASKQYPIHPILKKIHDKPNSKFAQELLNDPEVAELYNEIYNNGNEGEYNREKINRMGTTKDISAKRNARLYRRVGRNGGNAKNIFQETKETTQETKNQELENSSFFVEENNKGYHYGDLGKARDTNFFSMRSSRRSTGHFGHGTYFLGNKENVGSSSKGSRTLQEVDFSDYNLFKPLIENQAWRLHDGLKAINNEDYGNFDIELMKDVLKSYGVSQESIDKAIEKTMDYSIKLDSKNYEEQLEADSPSTVFMKALGYEGIDVRGLDGLDNTTYGSVIYDLDNTNPTEDADIRYSLRVKEANTGEDNSGNKLSEGMKNYMQNSKATDEKGNLIQVFHTTTDEVAQFNEFNPVGTDYYRFGDQVVNYYTNSKDMSGSYASQKYKMADTKKLNNRQELDTYLSDLSKETGNLYSVKQREDGKFLVSQDKQISREARDFINSISENEQQQMLKNIYEDNDMGDSNYERVFSWTAFDKTLQKKYHEAINKYMGTADLVAIQQEMMKYLESPVLLHEDSRLNGEVVNLYDNETDMLRNVKSDIQKSDWSKNSKIQYQGYVNITNPYVVDAEERNWNQVIQQSNEFIDELDERVPQDVKNNLTRLYNESANKSNEARDTYDLIQRTISDLSNRMMTPMAINDDIMKANEIVKRIGFQELNDYLDNNVSPGVNFWYNIADELQRHDVIGSATHSFIIDEFRLPENVRKWLEDNYNEYIDTKNLPISDKQRAYSIFGTETNLRKIYETNYDVYQEFDKYRMPSDYFMEQISSEGNDYLGYELNDIFETRAEIMGADVVGEEIARAASVAFSKPEMIRLWGTSKTTNDIVKEIIASNQDGTTNYDGIIIKNVVDYGGKSEVGVSANDLYITFSSNQFKAIDNENPTDDPDIRYSLNGDYRGSHQIENAKRITDLNLDDIQNKVIEVSGGLSKQDYSDLNKLKKIFKSPNEKVKIYRASPVNELNSGDWVTTDKSYARNVANQNGGKVYEYEVDANQLYYPDNVKELPSLHRLSSFQYIEENTRQSQQNKGWQSFLDSNFESRGTKTRLGDIKLPGLQDAIQEEVQNQTQQALLPIANELKELNKNLNKVMNPSEIAQLTPQDANTTPILPGVNRNQVGDGKSKFFDNINNKVNMLNDEQKTAILNDEDVKYYDKVTNKDSLDEAFARLQENGASESLRWFNNKAENANATDVAEGWILLKQYADSGNTEGMVEVAKKLREIGTKAGQTVQAFNILSRLTPEGMVKYAQSELMEAYDKMVKGKSAKWIEQNRSKFDLQPSEVQFIMDTMKEVSTMEDGYDKRFKLAQIQKIMTDKLPPSKGAGIKAWMRISMLFNPKTQVRNVAGNAIIAPINAFGDLFASGADKLISKKTGVRTTGTTNLKNYMSGAKQGLYQSYNDFKHGVNTRNIQGNRFEITEGRSFNNNKALGKALNKVDSILSFMLDAGDRTFYEGAFVNSINNQLVLNNTTEVTDTMVDIATQEALSRTWQDNNKYTKFVLSIRNQLNQVNIGGYGLGDVLIPFAKTPANLTKAIIDYSPVGLVGTINKGMQLNRSLTNGQYSAQLQHEFVQSLGKTVAGTALYILGLALANAGVTTGESDEDKDVANFMKNTMGVNSYSIKIGDMSFTYDWAQPLAAPLSITANLVQKQKEEASLLENITSTLDTAGNLLLEQSFMESINTVLNNNEGIATGIQEAILDLPSRAIPTFFKQIVDLTDGTQRQTFVKGKPIESAWNSVKAKLPGLSYTLDPSVDTLGRDIEKHGGKNNLFNVFLNPANVNTENVSESAQEIYRVYKETGENSVMPRVAPYYVTIDNEKINLSTTQRTEYQRVSGEIIESNVQNLIGMSEYQNMSDEQKAEVIKNVVNYSYNIAQKEVLGKELSDAYEKAYEYSKIGDISDYYAFKESIDDTNASTKRISIRDYLVNSFLNNEQIAYLYGGYYSSENELNLMLDAGISMKEFIKFNSEEFTSDYNRYGKAITNSRRNKIIKYVNGLNLTLAQKAILIKSQYSSYDRYDKQIFNHINGLNYSSYDKMVMLKKLGFDDYDSEIISHVNSQNISKDEKIEILKEMGFTVRNGRVYS